MSQLLLEEIAREQTLRELHSTQPSTQVIYHVEQLVIHKKSDKYCIEIAKQLYPLKDMDIIITASIHLQARLVDSPSAIRKQSKCSNDSQNLIHFI